MKRALMNGRSLGLALVVAVAMGALWTACPSKGTSLRTSRSQAKPWKASLAEVFDDELDYRTLATLKSDEPFAVRARRLMRKRIQHADIVVLGEVLNIADMMGQDGVSRRGVLLKVVSMLRGNQESLPGNDKDQISLFLSDDHPSFEAEALVGKEMVLFLRWLPGSGEPAFRWHSNLASEKFVRIVKIMLKRRDAKGKKAKTDKKREKSPDKAPKQH